MRQIHLAEYSRYIDSPTSGSYFFEGKQVDKMTENQLTALRKGNLGFIFQSFNLIDELTVYEKCGTATCLSGYEDSPTERTSQ